MKKTIFTILLGVLLIPSFVKAATLIENLEVERSADTYTFSMNRNSWTYTLFTDKDTANIKVTAKDGVTVTGNGEVPIQEGANQLTITATDGTNTETYTLNLNVVKTEIKNGEIVNPPTGHNIKTISIVSLFGLGIIITLLNKKKVFYKL